MTDDRPVVLEVEGVTKRFGAVTALSDVSLQLRARRGAGAHRRQRRRQEHARRVVSRRVQPTRGGSRRRRRAELRRSTEARAAGIETVFQNLALVPTLDIAENVYLRREAARARPGRARRCAG